MFLYGADYNPEQWKNSPEILDKDIELMKKANCNVMSVGIFGWSEMEPSDGVYDFSFYEKTVKRLYDNGIMTILATPSAAMPPWLAKKYPEVMKTDSFGVKQVYGDRVRYCFTSPEYRRKVREINEQLALKFKDNPAIYAWHVSNEYAGNGCYCPLCEEAFRNYLKKRYDNDLDKLNCKWWNTFWSHKYSDWNEIDPPMETGEKSSNALKLNWKRFVTYQVTDFYKNEMEPLKRIAPRIPVTTNFHGTLEDLDYSKLGKYIDFACWDAYPHWGSPNGDENEAAKISFVYDFCRSIKHNPFLLMESTPSNVNWAAYNKLKRPGMNMLSSLQAVSNGSDSVQYFQWRKSRGSSEKFHGAVIDHNGREDTRVFCEVAELGRKLKKISEIRGTTVKAEAAVIYDFENKWAIDEAEGFQKRDKKYREECQKHYKYLWKHGINADVIDSGQDFSNYKIILAPMLYMIKPGVAERLCSFVKNGGILVSGYMAGYVDEDDLCFIGGFPGGALRKLFGLWNEEIDTMYPEDKNSITYKGRNYDAFDYCEIIHAETADVLAKYNDDFYAGTPAITVNKYGRGKAYYIAFRGKEEFLTDYYKEIFEGICSENKYVECPENVSVRTREKKDAIYFFVQNWNEHDVNVKLKCNFINVCEDVQISGNVCLKKYDTLILKLYTRRSED